MPSIEANAKALNTIFLHPTWIFDIKATLHPSFDFSWVPGSVEISDSWFLLGVL